MQTCSFATLVQMHATCPPRPSDTGPYTLICLAPPIQAPSTGRPRCPAGQQAWLSSLQEPLSCSAATAADLVCLRLCMIIAVGIKGAYGWLTGKPVHRIRKHDGKMMLSCCTAKPVLYILDSICCSSGNILMYSV